MSIKRQTGEAITSIVPVSVQSNMNQPQTSWLTHNLARLDEMSPLRLLSPRGLETSPERNAKVERGQNGKSKNEIMLWSQKYFPWAAFLLSSNFPMLLRRNCGDIYASASSIICSRLCPLRPIMCANIRHYCCHYQPLSGGAKCRKTFPELIQDPSEWPLVEKLHTFPTTPNGKTRVHTFGGT